MVKLVYILLNTDVNTTLHMYSDKHVEIRSGKEGVDCFKKDLEHVLLMGNKQVLNSTNLN